MNTRGALFTFNKTTSNCIKQQNTFGFNGAKSLFGNEQAKIHKTAQLRYPAAKPLMLPNNLQSVVINEIGRFSPQRTRDINGPVMVSQSATKAIPVMQIQSRATFDPRVACFDCSGAVNLNSSMQSTVPSPFSSKGKSTHLNMPGGQWEQSTKFISGDLQKAHYSNIFKKEGTRMLHSLTNRVQTDFLFLHRCESTKPSQDKEPSLSRKDKLKRAIAEYGSTVVVFHIGISLVSLGTCYGLVSSGIDIGKLLVPIGISGTAASNAGTFVTAYAIHKVFAPVRISITLAATPFIVKYLRHIGFLKKPKVK